MWRLSFAEHFTEDYEDVRPGMAFKELTVCSAGSVEIDREHGLIAMLKAFRLCLLILTMLSLALAGPVQANCDPQPAVTSIPCGDMAMNGADDDGQQPQPDAPQKACSIVQCPSALPGFTGGSTELRLPVARALSRTAIPSPVPPGAESAPEQRPPIS